MKSENVEKETVGFISENAGYSANFAQPNESILRSDSISGYNLSDFLSRPVKIMTINWLESDPVGNITNEQPWYKFFNDDRIKYKLNNFAFIRCVLHLKFVVNASPFYYGAGMFYYQPLHTFNTDTMVPSNADQFMVTASQRPHVWIYPQGNQGAEMTLPFVWHKQWVRTSEIQEFQKLGLINFLPYTTLQSANGVTGTGVTISVFAWAEKVEITGPTVGLALPQAGDEYTGSVSKPSSMVASVASRLTSLPVIGPFAKATSIGAGAIASIAHLFGFTNTPVLADVMPFQPRPLHNLADTTIGYPVDKLTLDPKNELGISTALVGVDEETPLVISKFIERESYLYTATWSTLNNPEDILFSATINPAMARVDTSNATHKIYGTPMSHIAALFNYWRGDIIVRFHFICSQFHKGRIRIQWDPAGHTTHNIIADAASYSGCFNEVIDLGKDTNIEFRIPYLQATPFLYVGDYAQENGSTSLTPTFNYNSQIHNGTIVLRCVTNLTAPVALSEIKILISVRSANVEFANPSFPISREGKYAFTPPQGGFEYDDAAIPVSIDSPNPPSSALYITNMGEQVVSLRQLIKRSCFVYYDCGTTGNDGNNETRIILYRVPQTYGYATGASLYTADSLLSPGTTKPFNFSPMNPLTWLIPCFIGQRGSINYSIAVGSAYIADHPIVTVSRLPFQSTTAVSSLMYSIPSTSRSQMMQDTTPQFGNTSGMTVQVPRTNSGVEVQIPNYSQYLFQQTDPRNANTPNATDASDRDCFMVSCVRPTNADGPLHIFAGAGPDFNLIFFLNVPVVYKYTAAPTAV